MTRFMKTSSGVGEVIKPVTKGFYGFNYKQVIESMQKLPFDFAIKPISPKVRTP